MEFSRTLYRVHERMLKAEGIRKIVNICYFCTFVLSNANCFKIDFLLAMITLPIFLYANIRFKN